MNPVAKEIMTRKLVTVHWEDSVRKAYQIMQERKIRHLPVVDEKGEVIGILSDRDVRQAMTPKTEFSGRSVGAETQEAEFDSSFQVKDFMSWPVCSVNREVPVEEVVSKMLRDKMSALMVADHKNHFYGIITTDDLLKLLLKLLDKEPGKIRLSVDSIIQEFGISSGHYA